MLPLHLSQLLFPIFIFISDSDTIDKGSSHPTQGSEGKKQEEMFAGVDAVPGLCLAAWPQVSSNTTPLSTVFASGILPSHNVEVKH